MHTAVTVDGKMTEAQACERAITLGLQEIAFTNHAMLTEPDYTMSAEALLNHWEQIQVCQQQYPQLKIRLGLEMDYYEGREDEIQSAIQKYENLIGHRFDLVLGAVHHLRGVFFSSKKRAPELYNDREIVTLYHDYFAMLTKAVASRLFDVMAHPDLIKKYTGELSPRVPFDAYRAAVASFIDALLGSGVGIEINTKGLKLQVGEFYPSAEFLALYVAQAQARGIKPIVTIGSDAHKIEDVGARIPEGAMAIQRAGCATITLFENRKPIALLLEA